MTEEKFNLAKFAVAFVGVMLFGFGVGFLIFTIPWIFYNINVSAVFALCGMLCFTLFKFCAIILYKLGVRHVD